MSLFDRLDARARTLDSPLCVGLDPRVDPASPDAVRLIGEANRRIIEKTASLALCYKPNIAFYEQLGPAGMQALIDTIAAIPDDIPVVLDAKRGDIGATAQAYAVACRGLGVDAVTVSPYMGHDSIAPFTDAGLAVFVLCRTSNPGGDDFQALAVEAPGSRRLFEVIADRATRWPGEVGLVVAGNDPEALRVIRRDHPAAWFLAPGIGAQGGRMEDAVSAGLRADGMGLLAVVARGIATADDPGLAAREYVDSFRKARDTAVRDEAPRRPNTELLDAIIDTECFRVGEFTLKSGMISPFYIDLRRLQSDPRALETAAAAYERLLAGVRKVGGPADRLAGIPVAALPLATALSLRTRIPLIYPRLPAKPHGTGRRVEGEWKAGERVVLVDDLITTGLSKVEAVNVLREEGMVVEDLVVLVRRGDADLREEGVRVHAAVDITDLVMRARTRNVITEQDAERVIRFLEET